MDFDSKWQLEIGNSRSADCVPFENIHSRPSIEIRIVCSVIARRFKSRKDLLPSPFAYLRDTPELPTRRWSQRDLSDVSELSGGVGAGLGVTSIHIQNKNSRPAVVKNSNFAVLMLFRCQIFVFPE
eukprot:354459-Prorocentrum_minimum.AAC.1